MYWMMQDFHQPHEDAHACTRVESAQPLDRKELTRIGHRIMGIPHIVRASINNIMVPYSCSYLVSDTSNDVGSYLGLYLT